MVPIVVHGTNCDVVPIVTLWLIAGGQSSQCATISRCQDVIGSAVRLVAAFNVSFASTRLRMLAATQCRFGIGGLVTEAA